MPKIKQGEEKSDWMSRCMPAMHDEGRPHKQAIAICLSMFERGPQKPKRKPKKEGFAEWVNRRSLQADQQP